MTNYGGDDRLLYPEYFISIFKLFNYAKNAHEATYIANI